MQLTVMAQLLLNTCEHIPTHADCARRAQFLQDKTSQSSHRVSHLLVYQVTRTGPPLDGTP